MAVDVARHPRHRLPGLAAGDRARPARGPDGEAVRGLELRSLPGGGRPGPGHPVRGHDTQPPGESPASVAGPRLVTGPGADACRDAARHARPVERRSASQGPAGRDAAGTDDAARAAAGRGGPAGSALSQSPYIATRRLATPRPDLPIPPPHQQEMRPWQQHEWQQYQQEGPDLPVYPPYADQGDPGDPAYPAPPGAEGS